MLTTKDYYAVAAKYITKNLQPIIFTNNSNRTKINLNNKIITTN